MSPLDNERMLAALDLCAVVHMLRGTRDIPPHMLDYLELRVERLRRACGIPAPKRERNDA